MRNVLTEVLPYLNIYMTEELSDKEREELEEQTSAVYPRAGLRVIEIAGGRIFEIATLRIHRETLPGIIDLLFFFRRIFSKLRITLQKG